MELTEGMSVQTKDSQEIHKVMRFSSLLLMGDLQSNWIERFLNTG